MSDDVPVRRVLRWEVPVDSDWHMIGGGDVIHVGSTNRNLVEVWTIETKLSTGTARRTARVYGTGQPIHERDTEHLGTAIVPESLDYGRFVWHVFASMM